MFSVNSKEYVSIKEDKGTCYVRVSESQTFHMHAALDQVVPMPHQSHHLY